MAFSWFRWWSGTVNDPKLALVARDAGVPRAIAVAVWASVLERANDGEIRGEADGLPADEIAIVIDAESSEVLAVVDAMRARGMIEGNRVSAWDKRQPEREREDDSSAERVRRHREMKRHVTPCNASNANVTPCNAMKRHETPPDKTRLNTDTDLKESKQAVNVVVEPETPPTAPGSDSSGSISGDTEREVLAAIGNPTPCLSPTDRVIVRQLEEAGVTPDDWRLAYQETIHRKKPNNRITYLRAIVTKHRDERLAGTIQDQNGRALDEWKRRMEASGVP